jgi:hypothetical protein
VTLLDPRGWSFYCENCDDKTEATLVDEQDPETGEPYVELVCGVCRSILLTAQRVDRAVRIAEPSRN